MFFKHRKKAKKNSAKAPPSSPVPGGRSEEELKDCLSREVFFRLIAEEDVSDDRVREIIAVTAAESAIDQNLDLPKRRQLQEEIFNRFRRLDLLQPLLDRPEITEIMVNGPDKIFYEKGGKIYRSPQRFKDKEELQQIICGFFSRYNQLLSYSSPLASVRLPDGSRAHAVLPPAAPDGPVLTIRKFGGIKPELPELIREDFMDEKTADILINAVRSRRSVIIGGGTGSGKTTLLNILSAYIPENERIITIEDAPELRLQKRLNWVRLTCRPPGRDGSGGIDSALLIRNALRMRPDRIIVGEVRGDEAYDMMQAAMTGHPGTLCTIHANDCESMLLRLADLILAASRLRYEVILRHIASSFDYLLHLKRSPGGRRYVSELAEIHPSRENGYRLETLFLRKESR